MRRARPRGGRRGAGPARLRGRLAARARRRDRCSSSAARDTSPTASSPTRTSRPWSSRSPTTWGPTPTIRRRSSPGSRSTIRSGTAGQRTSSSSGCRAPGWLQMYTDILEFDVTELVRGGALRARPDDRRSTRLPGLPAAAAVAGDRGQPEPGDALVRLERYGLQSRRRRARRARVPGVPDAGTAPRRRHVDDRLGSADPHHALHGHPRVAVAWPDLPRWHLRSGAGMDGWIQFQNFGTAEQSNKAPAGARPASSRRSSSTTATASAPNSTSSSAIRRWRTPSQNGTTPPVRPAIGGAARGLHRLRSWRAAARRQPFP